MYKYSLAVYLRGLDWLFNKYVLNKKEFKRSLREVDMYLDLVTPGISKTLAIYKTREEDMVSILKDVLRPGMTVVDCGANIGFYPLLESKLLDGKGVIYAIEPDVRNYSFLEKNSVLKENKTSIKTFNVAFSNNTGTQQMFVAERANLNKLVSSADDDFRDIQNVNEVVDVKTVTCDDLCEEHQISIDFVRMDIEGFEVEVLQGMRNTIKNAEIGFMIFIELHPLTYTEERSFGRELEYLIEQGFCAKVLVSAGEAVPDSFSKLGYRPDKVIESDGIVRGCYYGIRNSDLVELACNVPKVSRYVLMQKKM